MTKNLSIQTNQSGNGKCLPMLLWFIDPINKNARIYEVKSHCSLFQTYLRVVQNLLFHSRKPSRRYKKKTEFVC